MRAAHAVVGLGLCLVAAQPLQAQGPPIRLPLDSGTVARLTWRADGRQQVQLVSSLGPTSDSVRYCTYPSSGCGPGSVNPVQVRPTAALAGIEVRHGNHVRRGALWGAAVGIFMTAYGLTWMANAESKPSTGRQIGISTLMLGGSIGVGALLGSGGHDWVPADHR
ncbi:MAG TPA: hypothetical protein VFH51_02835 [Myxococcota bacterium]|jgi:hypothetical protein|nr:hypothetical protein [Myxococcota bacterium]